MNLSIKIFMASMLIAISMRSLAEIPGAEQPLTSEVVLKKIDIFLGINGSLKRDKRINKIRPVQKFIKKMARLKHEPRENVHEYIQYMQHALAKLKDLAATQKEVPLSYKLLFADDQIHTLKRFSDLTAYIDSLEEVLTAYLNQPSNTTQESPTATPEAKEKVAEIETPTAPLEEITITEELPSTEPETIDMIHDLSSEAPAEESPTLAEQPAPAVIMSEVISEEPLMVDQEQTTKTETPIIETASETIMITPEPITAEQPQEEEKIEISAPSIMQSIDSVAATVEEEPISAEEILEENITEEPSQVTAAAPLPEQEEPLPLQEELPFFPEAVEPEYNQEEIIEENKEE